MLFGICMFSSLLFEFFLRWAYSYAIIVNYMIRQLYTLLGYAAITSMSLCKEVTSAFKFDRSESALNTSRF